MSNVTNFPKVLALDVSGNPTGWISYQESATYYSKGKVAWVPTEADFDLRGGTNSETGERTILTISTIIAIHGKISAKAMENANRISLDNPALFARDRHTCAYCTKTFTSGKLTRDHVIPTSRGGKNEWTNCVTSCSPCNKIKDDSLLSELDDFELAFVPYRPTRAEYLILENRNILEDQMNFLLKLVPAESQLLMELVA